jgi:hypothetical protein
MTFTRNQIKGAIILLLVLAAGWTIRLFVSP